MPKRYTITTPIYYVNSVPHIGTSLTTLVSDVCSRYQKLRGNAPFFLTGTDENGLKILEAAEAAGETPQAFVDRIGERFKEVWAGMNFQFDDFIRTTEPRHVKAVQVAFTRLKDKGHVYLDTYEGWYDVSSETFYKEADLVDGKSPDGNEVRWVEEENWFFRLSAFSEPLLAHIDANPDFILPETRKNEVVSFVRQGLRDMCISRKNPGWGIPIPGDADKVVYVWFDALLNYISAIGWPDDGWQDFWPAEVEWMGKEILTRFHATLWPAMLMALDLPLPKHLVGHGFILMGVDKISKSRGNVVLPLELAAQTVERSGCYQEVAVDVVRYYLCATLPFESDSNFTMEDYERRYNADLANDLGNALNRSLSMAHKFVEGKVPAGRCEPEMAAAIEEAKSGFEAGMDSFRLDRSVEAAWNLVRFLNKYIDTRAPWALAKSGDPALAAVMRSMLVGLRACEGLVAPIMPSASARIAAQFGLEPISNWSQIGSEADFPAEHTLNSPSPIFPRIEAKPAAPEPKPEKPEKPKPAMPEPEEIDIQTFMKVKLRVARILEAEAVPDSQKLVKLQVLIGEERRQILAGIRKSYDPADLVGRQVIVVANLKPAKLMGLESQGMVLAADGPDGQAILLTPEQEAPEGTSVH